MCVCVCPCPAPVTPPSLQPLQAAGLAARDAKPRRMATARLQLDESAIRPAIAEVRDDGLDTDFLILHYESKNSIVLKTKGSGGLPELHASLDEDGIQYCFFRFMAGDQESRRVKFIFLTYMGRNVGGMAKGRAAGHKGDVQALLGQSHLQISADGDRDEFTETEVADKIKKAAGANYDLGSNTGNDGKAAYATQVGTPACLAPVRPVLP